MWLRARDFASGPVRLHRPVTALLAEDVAFDPSTKPTTGDGLAHSRGWICAIAIESSDVVLNLNQKRIEQTARHALLVRFFATILIGSSLFRLPTQGPFNMGGSACIERVSIRNGLLGRSSHFQIFSPCCHQVSLSSLQCEDFEVAAVQLNGASSVQMRELRVGPAASPQVLGPAFTHLQLLIKELDNDPERETRMRAATLLFGNGECREGATVLAGLRKLLSTLEGNIQDNQNPFDGVAEPQILWLRESSMHLNGNLYGVAVNGDALLGGNIGSSVDNAQQGDVVIRHCKIQDLRSTVNIWPLSIEDESGVQVKTAGKAVPHLQENAITGEVVLSELTWGQLLWLQDEYAAMLDDTIDTFVRAVTAGSPEVAADSVEALLARGPFRVVETDCMAHSPKGTSAIVLKNLRGPVVEHCQCLRLVQTGAAHGRHGDLSGGDVCGVLLIDCSNALIHNLMSRGLESTSGNVRSIALIEGSTQAEGSVLNSKSNSSLWITRQRPPPHDC